MEEFIGQYGMIILLVVLFIIMIVPSILKSRKELKAREELNESIKKGTKVITAAGIYGKVVDMVETSDGTVVTITTGDAKNPSTLTMHINAIGGIDNKKVVKADKKSESESEDEKVKEDKKKSSKKDEADTKEEA
ncbi:MAG: preprotein translocase subunit YajC [Clostridia bacterium]|nr:preprotein translocase subunit YajC [Clostridia bacterium]